MQELILTTLSKWAQSLDFHFSRKGENYIFICEELGIHVNAISQDEFFTAMTNELLLKVEKFLKLESLGSDLLRDLLGLKKETPKQPQETKVEPKPSAKTEEKAENFEKWIKDELEKAHKNGEFSKIKEPPNNMQDLMEYWRTQKYNFPDYRQKWMDPRFPWDQVICWEVK